MCNKFKEMKRSISLNIRDLEVLPVFLWESKAAFQLMHLIKVLETTRLLWKQKNKLKNNITKSSQRQGLVMNKQEESLNNMRVLKMIQLLLLNIPLCNKNSKRTKLYSKKYSRILQLLNSSNMRLNKKISFCLWILWESILKSHKKLSIILIKKSTFIDKNGNIIKNGAQRVVFGFLLVWLGF